MTFLVEPANALILQEVSVDCQTKFSCGGDDTYCGAADLP